MDETGSKSMDLSQVRSEIDRVDSDILRLFIERMELAERAAQAKQAAGLPLQNRAREREILVAWLKTDSKTAVGQELFLTASTVRTYLQRIREKYARAGRPARTKAALAARAIQDGYIGLDEL